MTNAEMISDILAGGRVINREERMSETLDVMCENIHQQRDHASKANAGRERNEALERGYGAGNGRKQGD